MADRPKREDSDMREDPGFEMVKESQCKKCIHNKGLECDVYGYKPMEYCDALSDKKCPDRKAK